MNKTQIVEMEVENLVGADWNYKTDGTEEQINKLKTAIEFAGSCGVLMVREIDRDGEIVFEVMDGNHRLKAIQMLGWKKVPIENHGKISQARAVVLARQRNEQWFEDDRLKLANLYNDHVFKEFTEEQLGNITTDTALELEILRELSDHDSKWEPPEEKAPSGGEDDEDGGHKLVISLSDETLELWNQFKKSENISNHNRAFERLLEMMEVD